MSLLYILCLFNFLQKDTAHITTTAIIRTAYDDPSYHVYQGRIEELKENSFKMSYLDHLELRTRTREFDPKQQMFRFRAYTNFPKERRIHKNYYDKILAEEDLNGVEQLNHLIKDRYQLIISLIKNERVLEGKKELEILMEDRLQILRKKADNLDFDHQELLDAENDYHRLLLDQIDLSHKLEIAKKNTAKLTGINQEVKLSRFDLVSVKDIETFIKNVDIPMDASNFHYAQQSVEVDLAKLEYRKKKASEQNLIKYFEASYRDDLNDDFNKDLSIGVGIKIPIGSSIKSDLSDEMIDITKEKNNLDLLLYELSENINSSKETLEVLIKKHNVLSQILESDGQENSLRNYQNIDGVSPLILLKVKENIIKKKQIILELEKDIFTEYIEFLDICGLLVAPPFTNYFSKTEVNNLIQIE